jgi:pimeloyl-ACP methyl ester carboxylesterase
MAREKKKIHPIRFLIKLLLIIFAVYIVVGFLAVEIMLKLQFARVEKVAAADTSYMQYEDYTDFPRTEISFMSGDNTLEGFIYGAENDKGLVVFVHGFGGCSDNYLTQYEYLVDKGYRVFAYDGTGVCGSEGTGRMSFYQSTLDLAAALDYINADSTLSALPLALMGHSQGGFAVCSVLSYPEAAKVKAVVSFAAPNGAGDIVKEGAEQIAGVLTPIVMPFITITDNEDFGKDTVSAVEGINAASAGVLLFQGTADETITPDKIAVTHYTDDFTNPNVRIVMCGNEWDDGHEEIVYSKDAYYYLKAANEASVDYMTENGIEKFTQNDRQAFLKSYGFDKKSAREANKELLDTADEFVTENF